MPPEPNREHTVLSPASDMNRFLILWGALLALIFTAPQARAQSATLTANTATYDSTGGTVTFTSTLTYSVTPTAYAFSVQLPAGWTFVSQSLGSGLSASASPAANDNLLEWAFSGFPATQTSWTFQVSYPAGLSGDQVVSVTTAQYRSPLTNLSVGSVSLTRAVPVAPSITSQPVPVTATVGDRVMFSVGAVGTAPLGYQWNKNGAAIGGATTSSYTIGSVQTGDAGNYTVTVSNSVGSVTSQVAALVVNQPAPEPRITVAPQSQTVNAGTSVTFTVGVTGLAPLNYQWSKNNVAILGATGSTYSIASAQSRDSGTYTVRVWNGAGEATSAGAVLTVNGGSSGPEIRLVNIATRAYCTTGLGVAIGGFVISGSGSKQVLVRAVGPTLTTQGIGQSEVLADPTIELHHGNDPVIFNDDWGSNANHGDIVTVGARIGATPFASSDTKSAALLLTLQPGIYTFLCKGRNDTSGIVLIEVYDAD
jgi:hypothetical protein